MPMDLDEQRTTIHRLLEPGDRRGDETSPVEIAWERIEFSGGNANTWHARLVSPALSITFGEVAETIHGTWFAAIRPNGRGNKPEMVARYQGRDTAVKHFEHWARLNWRRIPIQDLGFGSSTMRKADA